MIVFCISTPLLADEQKCIDKMVPTTSVQDFQINSDATVTDKQRNITWSRCVMGQTWENNQCIGKPKHVDWQQAQNLAKELRTSKSNQWRLPSIHELSSITELSCENPATNLQLFPNTPSTHFWTGVEFINDTEKAWQVFFGTGENHTAKKTTKAAIRFVRSTEK